MFRINRQIPRCVLTWVMVIVASCYDVLCEPCDGFSNLLSVLLEFYVTLGGLLFGFWLSQWAGSFLSMLLDSLCISVSLCVSFLKISFLSPCSCVLSCLTVLSAYITQRST